MKHLLKAKVVMVIIGVIFLLILILGIVSALTGVSLAYETVYRQAEEIRGTGTVINNQLYAKRYRNILDKYLNGKGYVTLERLVFYMQRTNNVLDVTLLSDAEWEKAYLYNINEKQKQMVPIKELCRHLKEDSTIPTYTKKSGLNKDGVYIEVLNLCVIDGVDITESNDSNESYKYLPYVFPLKDNYTVTSMVFENRDVNLDLPEEELEHVNYHSGWDFAVPIGTNFYSVCDGIVNKIVYTQFNDLSYNESKNSIGNYIVVSCNNGMQVTYHHIKANSVPLNYSHNGAIVKKGDMLGKTSSTGRSTGPHLHLGLTSADGTRLDVLEYIDFNYLG